MPTRISRFPIHDELTAPEGSFAVLKGAATAGASLPKFLGALAGAPAALRAYVRFRSELRQAHLAPATRARLALAVAEHERSDPGVALHGRLARAAGLDVDELARARRWDSGDPREAVLLRYVRALVEDRALPTHLHEEAREAGWTDEQLLETIAFVALERFAGMVNVAGDIPDDPVAPALEPLAA